jgi:hypothetical protein
LTGWEQTEAMLSRKARNFDRSGEKPKKAVKNKSEGYLNRFKATQ